MPRHALFRFGLFADQIALELPRLPAFSVEWGAISPVGTTFPDRCRLPGGRVVVQAISGAMTVTRFKAGKTDAGVVWRVSQAASKVRPGCTRGDAWRGREMRLVERHSR